MADLTKQGYGEPQVSKTPYAAPEPYVKQPRVKHLGRSIRVEGSMPDATPERPDVPVTARSANRTRALVSLLLILSGTMGVVAGVSLLVSPAMGVLVAGMIVLAVGLILGFTN